MYWDVLEFCIFMCWDVLEFEKENCWPPSRVIYSKFDPSPLVFNLVILFHRWIAFCWKNEESRLHDTSGSAPREVWNCNGVCLISATVSMWDLVVCNNTLLYRSYVEHSSRYQYIHCSWNHYSHSCNLLHSRRPLFGGIHRCLATVSCFCWIGK